mgnify:CR=1 FL=1
MSINYRPLWVMLLNRNMKKTDLISLARLTSNTVANMGKCEYISLRNLEKICRLLECTPNDVIEFMEEK